MTTENPSTLSHDERARTPTIESSSLISPYRCTQCSARPSEKARNLVVCIDGTSNQFGRNNTNVVKLFAKVDLETTHPEQFAYYSSGIGTRPKSLHVLDRAARAVTDRFDMAVAWNMEEIVKDAYGWLARTYREGDRIYLFGFSRGAYQVRVLAGMIHEVGLIRTPTEKQIGTAYDHYEIICPGRPETRQIARGFKNTFSWQGLRVHFVGVWDTVSSVGLIRGDVFLSTSSSAAHACHFRHALALDERRVKFMPEYFHEMNSQMDDRKSKYIVTSLDAEHAATPTKGRRESTESSSGTNSSGEERNKTTEIKEVWFAGSHSDVGGRNRPGKSHQAGNVSLLWMRREAAASGLVLRPTDIVWVPNDLDFGISNSMNLGWRIIEYLPIKHQVSFDGGIDANARRWHRLQPRRIIPGQKVHASILYANAYSPQATLGQGFDIPTIHSELEDAEMGNQIWETGFFDDTAAEELVAYLGGQEGVAPIYLDRLLFMLRFKEGKKCVRNVSGWQDQFIKLIRNPKSTRLVKLATIVAYYEASCDLEVHPESPASPHVEFSQDIFDDAKTCLRGILAKHRHRDCPRVVALLRPLTKHQILRERILTEDVLKTLMGLLDTIVEGENFRQAMDGLNCLLRYKDTQKTLIKELAAGPDNFDVPRLGRILRVNDTPLLTAALRMVLTLTRIPEEEARSLCSQVKDRIIELAKEDDRVVGLLAVNILLAIHDPSEQDQHRLDIHDPRIRRNLASALVRLSTNSHNQADGQGRNVDPGQEILRRLFELDPAAAPNEQQKKKQFLGELKKAAQKGNARERTAATMTLLKLCATSTIRDYLLEIKLLDVFVKQLQHKGRALLAAYALATCLKYDDMKKSMKDKKLLPKYIVDMLQLDYFDDAIGQVEGFQIFGDFMQHHDLREDIKDYDITGILSTKLARGKAKDIRTSLICLDIFRSFDPNGPWTLELVKKSLEYLQNPAWKTQKAGVAILSALARTKHGVEAIGPRIYEIVGMLLPEDYQLSTDDESLTLPHLPSRPPSWMLGPACALRTLAQNKVLRDRTRETTQYGSLKNLYLSGTLIDEADTSPWRIKTPNWTDVTDMLDKMIKAIDGELSEGGLMSIEDTVLPHIQHWDRLVTLLRNRTVAAVTILPLLLGVSALVILAAIMAAPVYLSARVYKFCRQPLSIHLNTRSLDSPHGGSSEQSAEAAHHGHGIAIDRVVGEGEGGQDACPPGEHHGGSPLGVEIIHTQDSSEVSRATNVANQE